MKKLMKKSVFITFFSVLLFLLAGCSNSSGGSTPESNSGNSDSLKPTQKPKLIDGEYVTYGEWPQTIKASNVTVDESVTRVSGAYTYYKGSDGAWYCKCLENAFYPDSIYSNGNIANQKRAYCERYFKVEPIKWRVLTHNYNGTGKALLLSSKVLINCAFYDDFHRVRKNLSEYSPYAKENHWVAENDYIQSRIRAYLNGIMYYTNAWISTDRNDDKIIENSEFENKGFLQTAFTQEEQENIVVTSITNDAENANPKGAATEFNDGYNVYANDVTFDDKLFLLSLKEVTDTDFGFMGYDGIWYIAQTLYPTDFAIANGTEGDSEEYNIEYDPERGTEWWLRSPLDYLSYGVYCVSEKGKAHSLDYVFNSAVGVAPALCIDLSVCTSSDASENSGAADSNEEGSPITEKVLPFEGTPYEECGSVSIRGMNFKLVKFGDFPQTRKLPNTEINEKIITKVGDYTYYKGYDGEWYAKVVKGVDDIIDNVYYKVEPIIWRVLTEDYDHDGDSSTPGKKLLLAEKILSQRSFYDFGTVDRVVNGETVYSNNYMYSKIRAYLNGGSYPVKLPSEGDIQTLLPTVYGNPGEQVENSQFKDKGFLYTAFTSDLRNKILVTKVDNSIVSTVDVDNEIDAAHLNFICPDTNDKVFLLSMNEVTRRNYGFEKAMVYIGNPDEITTSSRALEATDFAVEDQIVEYGWLLRSPSDNKYDAQGGSIHKVSDKGRAGGGSVSLMSEYFERSAGVVPAICID